MEIECIICLDKINKNDKIWTHCSYASHIKCISLWAESSNNEKQWGCIICRQSFQEEPEATCFCGKTNNPENQSCGEICENPYNLCNHHCKNICHFGNCPPCQEIVRVSCFCERSEFFFMCSDKKKISCDEICKKQLKCGFNCEKICHTGECICNHEIEVKCFCGKKSKNIKCSKRENFSCEEICQKKLACGNHFCEKPCHEESEGCSECVVAQYNKHCPCGKTEFSNNSRDCLEPVLGCGKICEKALPCKIHFCKETCHTGECNPCAGLEIEVNCDCGGSKRKVRCIELVEKPITCEEVCGKLLNCKRHKCEGVCCPAKNHPGKSAEHDCKNKCNKILSCKQHRCIEPCHRGSCGRCQNGTFPFLHPLAPTNSCNLHYASN